MGAGSFGAGSGPAGLDPVAITSPVTATLTPAAPYLDLKLKNFKLNADGSFAAQHPVDQAVQWSFAIRRGTHKADARIGHTLFDGPRLTGDAQLKDLTQRAADAFPFSVLLEKKQVAFEGVQVVNPKNGETDLAVHYRNLVLDPTQRLTASVS